MIGPGTLEAPVFSECVIGYRAWRLGTLDRLWPISDDREPWVPGINTARCNRAVPNAAAYSVYWSEGRRIFEARPMHRAPSGDCTCGLYSWRGSHLDARGHERVSRGEWVWGAVASWGRIEVHPTGVRAEHTCIVALGRPTGVAPEVLQRLERVAARYGVDLVPIDELPATASRHGTPLPEWLTAEPDYLPSVAPPVPTLMGPTPTVRARRPVPDRLVTEPPSLGTRAAQCLLWLSVAAGLLGSSLLGSVPTAVAGPLIGFGVAGTMGALTRLDPESPRNLRRRRRDADHGLRRIHFSSDQEAFDRL